MPREDDEMLMALLPDDALYGCCADYLSALCPSCFPDDRERPRFKSARFFRTRHLEIHNLEGLWHVTYIEKRAVGREGV